MEDVMRARVVLLTLLTIAALTALAVPAAAVWSDDPYVNNLVYPGGHPADADSVFAVPDGEGGAIILWHTKRDYGDADIFAQRISAAGDLLWPMPVAVCDTTGNQGSFQAVTDGAGGAYIAWWDDRGVHGEDVYCQHIGADGSAFAQANGVPLGREPEGYRSAFALDSDGMGGAVVIWHNRPDWTDSEIRAQRLTPECGFRWGSGGVLVDDGGTSYAHIAVGVASDESGGAHAFFTDYRSGTLSLYWRKVDAGGTVLGSAATAVAAPAVPVYGFMAVGDGDGAVFVTWNDTRTGDYALYAMRVDDAGPSAGWAANGELVCLTGEYPYLDDIVADGHGGAIALWLDRRHGAYDVPYVSRIGDDGTMLWGANGVRVSSGDWWHSNTALLPDGEEGAYVAWWDTRDGYQTVHLQRIDDGATLLFGSTGTAVHVGDQTPPEICLAPGASDGCIVSWIERRPHPDGAVFSQYMSPTGTLEVPAPVITEIEDEPGDQGGSVVVTWNADPHDIYPSQIVTHYSVWRRMPDWDRSGWSYVGDVTAHYFDEYALEAPTYGDSTAAGTPVTEYKVLAETDNQWVFYPSAAASGYSVDNLAPGAPLALRVGTMGEDVDLQWAPSRWHDEDLSHYVLHRSLSEGFAPDETTEVTALADTVFVDVNPGPATWYYQVIAVDVHDNESAPSNEGMANLGTGVIDPVIEVAALRGNHPNPFNPTTVIAFELPSETAVVLAVYSVDGRCVATLVDGVRSPGRQSAAWDGRSDSDEELPSGVYFARLQVAGETFHHRMVLLK